MSSFLFLDVNVWLALTSSRHAHHAVAVRWRDSIDDVKIYFCRFTQLGLLRLLTTSQVMGEDTVSQSEAWTAYRGWFKDSRVGFHLEPDTPELERRFHRLSMGPHPSPKLWADAYLAAFASVAGLTLVTFDRALGAITPGHALILS